MNKRIKDNKSNQGNENSKKRYNDVWAPTITLAVGLNSWVVLQPVINNVATVSNMTIRPLVDTLRGVAHNDCNDIVDTSQSSFK